jgi:small subunit ribosomal protein S6
MMNKYESIFIVNSGIGEDAIRAAVEKIKALIEANATLDGIDEWGNKKLAYEVMKQKEGYYVLAGFTSNPEFPKELERIFRITDEIIKYIIIKKEIQT